VKFQGEIVLWVVAMDDFASSYRVWRGARTAAALERELGRERRAGRAAHLELEAGGCPPVKVSLADMIALGIVAAGR
jgi:hypothetical protein